MVDSYESYESYDSDPSQILCDYYQDDKEENLDDINELQYGL